MLAVLWHRLRLPFWVELVAGRLDLFYSPDFTLPPVLAARTVVTVHDLSFVRLSECSEPGLSKYLLEAVPRSARRADLILVDSHCTGADARELLQLPPQRVQVLYPGVDSRFRPIRDADTLESLRTRLSLPPQFILAVGTLQPRKNYRRLLEAFAALRTGMEGLALVIAGAKGWLYEGIFHRVEELGLQDDVRGLARAAGFTWEDSARRLAQLLERVAAGTIDQA
jgi:glycosyltransferase involved in cell wall biosynthesis